MCQYTVEKTVCTYCAVEIIYWIKLGKKVVFSKTVKKHKRPMQPAQDSSELWDMPKQYAGQTTNKFSTR